MPRYKLVTTDKDGIKVRFTHRAFNNHKNRHRELQDLTFLPPRVVKALKEPHIIMPSYTDGDCICYYYEEFGGSPSRFTKVVVDTSHRDTKTKSKIYYIKTAFRPDNIKERKYKLKALYDSGLLS